MLRGISKEAQIAIVEIRKSLERDLRIELPAIESARTGKRSGQVNPAILNHCGDVDVVLNFRPLLHHGSLGSREIEQARYPQAVPGRDVRRRKPRKSRKSKKGEPHRSISVNDDAQGIRRALRDGCAGHKGNACRQFNRVELLFSEKVEIHGLSVAKMQRNRRPAIEHEFRRNVGKLLPKPPLRIGENIETWLKVVAHGAAIIAEPGTKMKRLQLVGFRKTTVNFPSTRRGHRLREVALHVDFTGTTAHGLGVVPSLHTEHRVHAQAESLFDA